MTLVRAKVIKNHLQIPCLPAAGSFIPDKMYTLQKNKHKQINLQSKDRNTYLKTEQGYIPLFNHEADFIKALELNKKLTIARQKLSGKKEIIKILLHTHHVRNKKRVTAKLLRSIFSFTKIVRILNVSRLLVTKKHDKLDFDRGEIIIIYNAPVTKSNLKKTLSELLIAGKNNKQISVFIIENTPKSSAGFLDGRFNKLNIKEISSVNLLVGKFERKKIIFVSEWGFLVHNFRNVAKLIFKGNIIYFNSIYASSFNQGLKRINGSLLVFYMVLFFADFLKFKISYALLSTYKNKAKEPVKKDMLCITQNKNLGDAVIQTMYLKKLKKTLKGKLCLVVFNNKLIEFWENIDQVDFVYSIPVKKGIFSTLFNSGKTLRKLYTLNYKYAINIDLYNFLDRKTRYFSDILLFLSAAPVRLGARTPLYGTGAGLKSEFLTHIVHQSISIPDEMCNPIKETYSEFLKITGNDPVEAGNFELGDFKITEEVIEKMKRILIKKNIREFILISPTTKRNKMLPPWLLIQFINYLTTNQDKDVIITLMHYEEDLIEPAKLHNRVSVFKDLTIEEVSALCTLSSSVIAMDNGIMHLSALTGNKTIGIFGPTDPNVWVPYSSKNLKIIRNNACSPCNNHVGCVLDFAQVRLCMENLIHNYMLLDVGNEVCSQ